MTVIRAPGGTTHGIAAVQAHLPAAASIALGALALGAMVLPGISGLTQHVNTMAHEGAHAAMGSATGQKITGVKLYGNGAGLTTMTSSRSAGGVLAGIVGYLGPSAFGLGAAELIRVGHAIVVLWVAIAALAVLGVLARKSAFGVTAVLMTGVLVYAVARYAPVGAQVALAYGLAWFLLLSGVQVVLAHGRDAGDAIILRQLTRMPRGLWAGLWLIGSALALIAGARMLV